VPDTPSPLGCEHAPRSLRWLARGLVAAGLGMLPWLAVLALTLPSTARAAHWPVAWIGLDGMEGAGLLATGVLLRRRDQRCSLTAAVTATLVLVDAWFDVTTSAPGPAEFTAVAMAACIEVPVSALCVTLAVRWFPRPCLNPERSPQHDRVRAVEPGDARP